MTFETAPDSQKSRSIAFDLHLWPHIINFCSLLYFFQIVDILSFPMMCNITILMPFEKWLKWVSKYSHFNYLCVFCHKYVACILGCTHPPTFFKYLDFWPLPMLICFSHAYRLQKCKEIIYFFMGNGATKHIYISYRYLKREITMWKNSKGR